MGEIKNVFVDQGKDINFAVIVRIWKFGKLLKLNKSNNKLI